MEEYTKEQFDQMPDFMQSNYSLDGDVYKHAGMIKMKGSMNDLNGKLTAQKGDFDNLNTRLTDFEASKAAEIEAAKAEALEQARSKGEVEGIEEIYKQKMTDLEARTAASTRLEVEKEFTLKGVESQAKLELTEMVAAMKPIDDNAKRFIEDHLKGRQTIEDGKIIYYNVDGSASSLDKAGLTSELIESAMFKSLSSYTPPTQGGGLMNGSDGSSAPSTGKKYSEMSLKERAKHNSQ
ncbi:MAG: hypothetical protein JKY50_00460 [Oleispira sp.]|nr:hypothetical protein [Oleispira sp.]